MKRDLVKPMPAGHPVAAIPLQPTPSGSRAYATLNAETMSADALQAPIRRGSYTTTQRYINSTNKVNRAVQRLQVAEILRRDVGRTEVASRLSVSSPGAKESPATVAVTYYGDLT